MKKKNSLTNSTNSSLTDLASHYATEVVSGVELAGPDIRHACQRHLQDISTGNTRGIVWDVEAAQRAMRFFSKVLKLNGGIYEDKPFHLLPWQAFVVGSLFGWKNNEGQRRFRMAYVEAGKGACKLPLAAGIGLYCLVADNEARAEIYAAATKKDQAMILFRDAVAMVDQSPKLAERIQKSGGQARSGILPFYRPVPFSGLSARMMGNQAPILTVP